MMYYGRLKGRWDELNVLQLIQCSCKTTGDLGSILAQNKLMQFLMGLHESFNSVRSQILAMDPLPPVNKAFSMILRVEKQRSVHTDLSSPSTTSENNSVMLAKYVQKGNSGKKKKDDHGICEHCKIPGHQKDSCFKILGYPDWYKHLKKEKASSGGKNNNSVNMASAPLDDDGDSKESGNAWNSAMVELVQQEIAKALKAKSSTVKEQVNFAQLSEDDFAGNVSIRKASYCSKDEYSDAWIVGTGATCHIVKDKKHFVDLKPLNNIIYVQLPDGSNKEVRYKGDIRLNDDLILYDALYMPSFYNLISVSRLSRESNMKVVFYLLFCLIQDLKTESVVARGKEKQHLYMLEPISFKKVAVSVDRSEGRNEYNQRLVVNSCKISSQEDFTLWHTRLGRPSTNVVNHLPFNKFKLSSSCCDICQYAKQSRLPFDVSNSQTSEIFELLHVDLWGSYRIPSKARARFFITLVDDHSRATWVVLLKEKSQVAGVLKIFIIMAENQFNKKVKCVRSDNGTEFTNSSCRELFDENEIQHQTSCVYSPQQNRVVERRHRTILNMARSLLFQSGMSNVFWGEAILYVVFLLNRLPSVVLKWKTPYQLLFGKIADYSRIKNFGWMCYCTIVSPRRDKFSPKASKCVFMGFSPGKKGYNVYNLEEKRFMVSRDVIFIEEIYPFKNRDVLREKEGQWTPPFHGDKLLYNHEGGEPMTLENREEIQVENTIKQGQGAEEEQTEREET